MFDLTGTTLAIASIAVLYLVLQSINRLYFSRISHIPGPKLAALTYFYQTYYDIFPYQGQFLFQCQKLHQQYGPIIRIGPDEIHINDISFYSEIYTNTSRKRDRSPLWFWMADYSEFAGRSAFCTISHDVHRMRRSSFAQFFSKKQVQELEPSVLDKVYRLRDALLRHAGTGELVNLLDACSGLTLEVISHYTLGSPVAVLDTEEMGRPWVQMLQNGTKIHPIGRAFPWLARSMLKLPAWMVASKALEQGILLNDQVGAKTRAAFDEATKIKEGTKKPTSGSKTVLHEVVLGSVLPANEKEYDRVKDDAMIFFGAGTETTGRTLAVTFFHILSNPDILKILKDEINPVMSGASKPTVAALEKLPYLSAVINEGLRIGHGTSGRLARTAPDEDLNYAGYKIPRGTTMSQSNYLIHVNPEIYPDPLDFHPERFLDGYRGVSAATANHSLVAFGRGGRMCVGMNLGNAEMYLTLAVLLSSVNMELAETTKRDVTVVAEYFTGSLPEDSKGVRVKVLGGLSPLI